MTMPDIRPTQVKVDGLNSILQRPVRAWFDAIRDRLLPAYAAALARADLRAQNTMTLDDVPDDVAQLRQEADTIALSIDATD
jgi:hypothetical protein